MIIIIDIGLGNVGSVANALKFLGCRYRFVQDFHQLQESIRNGGDKIIFPGVGNYAVASKKLVDTGLMVGINDIVKTGIPILGICLGMQLLVSIGTEGGKTRGLGLVDGKVIKIDIKDKKLNIPHMGWNEVAGDKSILFDKIGDGKCFYFVHSYECVLNENINVGYTDYSRNIVASFAKNNIYGTQYNCCQSI